MLNKNSRVVPSVLVSFSFFEAATANAAGPHWNSPASRQGSWSTVIRFGDKAGTAYAPRSIDDSGKVTAMYVQNQPIVSGATRARLITHSAATLRTPTSLFPVLFQVIPPDRLTQLTEELRQRNLRGDHQSAGRMIPDLLAEIAKGHPDAALAWNQAGVYFTAQGEFAEAERAYLKALRLTERQKDNNYLRALLLVNLATLYLETGRPVLAEHFSRRSLVPALEAYPPSAPELSNFYYLLGASRLQQGDTREGRRFLMQALELADSSGDRERLRGPALTNLAALEGAEHNWDRARVLFLESLAITESSMGASHPYLIRTHLNLARIYEHLKQWEMAKASLERAREITDLRLGPSHLLMAEILNTTASVLRKTGHGREEREMRRRAAAIAKAKPKDSGTISVHVSELSNGASGKP